LHLKSFAFAIRDVKLYQYLTERKREFVLSKQMSRSGTSIGANVREAQIAESKSDFAHKLGTAQKKVDEINYWLELLYAACSVENHKLDRICPRIKFAVYRYKAA
jgi:four helix bundle protein